jgi:FkbM family methyltransferase
MLSGLIDRWYIKNPRLRRSVTTMLEGEREVAIELLGRSLTVHSVKEHGYLRASRLATRSSVFRDEAAVLLSLAALLPTCDAFVDIGANVGLFSTTLAGLKPLCPHVRFYAFEANPDTFARLKQNAVPLGVEAHNMALSDHAGTLSFVSGAVSHVFTTTEHRSAYNLDGAIELPCQRLDALPIAGDRVLLKIDVEGQELDVLKGATALFDAGRVRAVYLDGYEDPAVASFLSDRGFLFHDGRTLAPVTPPVFSLLAIRPATA